MLNNILVTGGAGFLGSHLCNELLKLNFNVTCLDNLFTGKIENIKDNLNNPKFRFLEHDVTIFKNIKCNYIFHLACPASPVHYQKDPVKTISTNVAGTLNILELAKSNKSPVLFTSTSEVYGDPEMSPQKEDYWGRVNPIGIRSCYDEGKRCAETLCFDFHGASARPTFGCQEACPTKVGSARGARREAGTLCDKRSQQQHDRRSRGHCSSPT